MDHHQPQYLGERLARVEESLRHVNDKATTSSERIHNIANMAMATDGRLTLVEQRQTKDSETVNKLEPMVQEYQRRKDRHRFVKDALNWLTVPAVLYLAVSGRVQWGEALRALGKILGAG